MMPFMSTMSHRAATTDDAPDDVAQRFSAGLSRRRACQVLSGGVLGMVVAGLGLGEVLAGCRDSGERCRRNGQCCSNRCVRNRCRRRRAPEAPEDPESPPPVELSMPPLTAEPGRVRPDPPPPAEETDRERRVSVNYTGTMEIVDHETFAANERCLFGLDHASTPVLRRDASTHPMSWTERCGGEVKANLSLRFALRDNGDVAVSGRATLWEGTSYDTVDLDGRVEIAEFIVPWDSSVSKDITVRNEDEGGDFAVIGLTFRNVPFGA